jgi:hypothetical protein
VQYAYVEGSGANNSRQTSMTYPNGRVVNDNYNSGLETTISRLSSISDTSTLEAYKYLGLGTVVERDHPQPNVTLSDISQTGGTGDAGDKYTGLDRFGRIVDQDWYHASNGSQTDDFQYAWIHRADTKRLTNTGTTPQRSSTPRDASRNRRTLSTTRPSMSIIPPTGSSRPSILMAPCGRPITTVQRPSTVIVGQYI